MLATPCYQCDRRADIAGYRGGGGVTSISSLFTNSSQASMPEAPMGNVRHPCGALQRL